MRSASLGCFTTALIVAGAVLFTVWLGTVGNWWMNPRGWRCEHRVDHSEGRFGDAWENDPGRNPDLRWGASLRMMAGALLVASGPVLLSRRFTLRTLLLVVVCTGFAGSIPFLAPDPPPLSRITLLYPQSLGDDALARIEAKLELNAVLSKMPADFRKRYNPSLIQARCSRSPGTLKAQLEFSPRIPAEDRSSLTAFYAQFMSLLLREQHPDSPRAVRRSGLNYSEWTKHHAEKWEADYLLRHPPPI